MSLIFHSITENQVSQSTERRTHHWRGQAEPHAYSRTLPGWSGFCIELRGGKRTFSLKTDKPTNKQMNLKN